MSAVHAAAPAVTRSAQKLFNRDVATVLRSEYGITDVSTVWVTDLVKEFARTGDALACARALVEFPRSAARDAAADRVIALGRMAITAREMGLESVALVAEERLQAAVAEYNALV